jgi:hypothetical protein
MKITFINKAFRLLIPLDCLYILIGVGSAFRSPQINRLISFYMLVVFLLNIIVWKYWDSPNLKRTPKWRRVLRFCVWIVLLINVPMLALGAVEERSVFLVVTMIYAVVISGAAFWLSNWRRVT